VAFGTRLDEDNYAELEFRRIDDWTTPDDKHPVSSRIVATLAVTDPLFHYTGKFDTTLALRNLFIEEKGVGLPGLSLWVGSRMYRGDDIYLLNWWPLDNLNTLGGGARIDLPSRTKIAVHAGVVRLDDPFQYQSVARPLPYNQLGTTKVAIFDRPRVIGSLRAEHIFPLEGTAGLKVVGYGELHHLAKGVRETQPAVYENMPSDGGFVAGAQVGAFTGQRDTFVNLFFRYARGLAAYGDFSVPYELNNDRTAAGAHERGDVGQLGGRALGGAGGRLRALVPHGEPERALVPERRRGGAGRAAALLLHRQGRGVRRGHGRDATAGRARQRPGAAGARHDATRGRSALHQLGG
jgi:hypothetical protein